MTVDCRNNAAHVKHFMTVDCREFCIILFSFSYIYFRDNADNRCQIAADRIHSSVDRLSWCPEHCDDHNQTSS